MIFWWSVASNMKYSTLINTVLNIFTGHKTNRRILYFWGVSLSIYWSLFILLEIMFLIELKYIENICGVYKTNMRWIISEAYLNLNISKKYFANNPHIYNITKNYKRKEKIPGSDWIR